MPLLISYQSPDDFKVLNVTAFIGDKLNIGSAGAPLTVVSNTVTMTRSFHSLVASGTTTLRSLRTINGGLEGDILILRLDATSPQPAIIDDNSGNIQSAGNFTLSSPKDLIAFLYDGTDWCEIARSNNA